ncbi:MAG: DUF4349 domain-containing protein [Actinobacteria bacterium]|nr:DUF4349 domain-containing protein [Actinomycetota bacterium]
MKLKWLWLLVIALLLVGCAPAGVQQVDKAAVDQGSKANEALRAGASKPAAAPAAPAPPGGAPANTAAGETTAPWDRMIIRTASLILVVGDVEQALAAARDVAQSAGGFVAKSSSRYEGEFQLADITIQVPSVAYDNTIQRLRGLAVRVDNETSSSQDVTEEYTDLDSQLRNLQATEASLVRLMDRSTQISDIIAVQKELTNVRGQIERIQGRMKYLSRRSDMSTISLSLIPEAKSKKRPPEGWNPLRSMANAWEASLAFLRVVTEVALVAVVFLSWLIIPVGVALFFIWRRRRQRPPVSPGPTQPQSQPTDL